MESKKTLFNEMAYCLALYLAAQNGHKHVVKFISELPFTLDESEVFKLTALFFQAQRGNLAAVKRIIGCSFTFSIDNEDDYGIAGLFEHGKIINPSEQLITTYNNQLFIAPDNKKNVNICNTNVQNIKTIFEAAQNGGINELKSFLDSGVDVNSVDENKKTALHLAASNGMPSNVKFLIKHNANLKCKDKNFNTPFHLSAQFGHVHVLNIFLKNNMFVDIKNSLGNTPMHLACKNDHTSIVELLINEGANFNIKNAAGDTPLHFAIAGSEQTVQLLIKHGADINMKNKKDETIFSKAQNVNHLKLLLSKGFDINYVDKSGNTSMHLAARYNRSFVIDFLIKEKLNIECKNKLYETPFYVAAKYGQCAAMEILLRNGARICSEVTSTLCNNSLHIATMNGFYGAVELLLEYGIDVNVANNRERKTALMFAAQYGRLNIAKLLLAYQADKALGCYNNNTASYYATSYKFPAIVNVLKDPKDGK